MELLISSYAYILQSREAGIAQGLSDVVSVQILPERQHQTHGDQEKDKVYTLDDLRSLESRLVLIGGNYGRGQHVIKLFVEVSTEM